MRKWIGFPQFRQVQGTGAAVRLPSYPLESRCHERKRNHCDYDESDCNQHNERIIPEHTSHDILPPSGSTMRVNIVPSLRS